ncbi:hypothetical protein ACIBSW_11375 [Actinoplanes sp. NPDC049668]|uniref:hypothetical protein n=1 Tax=unclassified Actinoplanes TaxID=2626549 RepID=UPI0033BE25A6
MRRKLLAAGIVTALTSASISVIGSPAAADTKYGCRYPRVCLYLNSADWMARKPTAAYQDITSNWQQLGSRGRQAYAVYNSRDDDTVWLTDGNIAGCLDPNEIWFYEPDVPMKIVKIRIKGEPDCFGH